MKKLIYCLVILLCVVNFASAQDLPDGLIAYYSFNGDANNQAADLGHGTVVGALLTDDRNGNPNSAYLFGGVEDEYIEISDTDLVLPLGDEPRTFALWARCDDPLLEDGHMIAYGNQDEGQHCHLSMHAFDGIVRMGFWYNDIDGVVDVFDPIWHHIAAVYDGKDVDIYFDGDLVESRKPSLPVNTIHREAIYLRIGCQNSENCDNKFAGAIDDVMIFSRALKKNEISTIVSFDDTDVDEGNHRRISSFKLYQNYPNPFNPTTEITFSIPEITEVNLEIFNAQGQLVDVVIKGELSAGLHRYSFGAQNLPSGIYYYKLHTGNEVQIRKMVYVK